VDGEAHFLSTDNGGAYVREDSSSVTAQLPWFSRYDRKTIDGLREINQFLLNPEKGFLGYDDSANFVTDLGLYFQLTPAFSYARPSPTTVSLETLPRLRRN
jgi:hypothetical protein